MLNLILTQATAEYLYSPLGLHALEGLGSPQSTTSPLSTVATLYTAGYAPVLPRCEGVILIN